MRLLLELLVCRWRGHVWGKVDVGMFTASQWCDRCGRHRFLSYYRAEYELASNPRARWHV